MFKIKTMKQNTSAHTEQANGTVICGDVYHWHTIVRPLGWHWADLTSKCICCFSSLLCWLLLSPEEERWKSQATASLSNQPQQQRAGIIGLSVAVQAAKDNIDIWGFCCYWILTLINITVQSPTGRDHFVRKVDLMPGHPQRNIQI